MRFYLVFIYFINKTKTFWFTCPYFLIFIHIKHVNNFVFIWYFFIYTSEYTFVKFLLYSLQKKNWEKQKKQNKIQTLNNW